jgi:hypothetical protein
MTGCSKKICTGCRGFDKEPAVLGAASYFWSEEYRASLRTYAVDELLPGTGIGLQRSNPSQSRGLPCAHLPHRHLVI